MTEEEIFKQLEEIVIDGNGERVNLFEKGYTKEIGSEIGSLFLIGGSPSNRFTIKDSYLFFRLLGSINKLRMLVFANVKIGSLNGIENLEDVENIYFADVSPIVDFVNFSLMKNLKKLNIQSCNLGSLYGLSFMNKSIQVDLTSNTILEIPEELAVFNSNFELVFNDQMFSAKENTIFSPPVEVIRRGPEKIKQYYLERGTNLTEKKIESLSISNFQIIKKINIQLSKNVTVILGGNGSGKTTMLKAIAFTFLHDDSKDIKAIDFEPLIKIGENFSEFLLNFGEGLTRSCYLHRNTKEIINGSCGSSQVFLAYGANTFTRYNDMNYEDMVGKIIGGDEILHHTSSLFKESDDSFFNPLAVFNKLEMSQFQDEDNRETIKQIKSTLLEKLNSLIPSEIRIKIEKTNYHFYNAQETKLTLQQLSEGYRTAVLVLTDILIRIMSMRNEIKKYVPDVNPTNIFEKAFGILAIDEFDRHLHPTWQLEYIKKLQDVLPNMQLVLTTHNPLSILDREEDEVLQLVMDEDTNELAVKKYKGGTKNMDVVMVLLKYFDVNYVVSQSFRKKIDRFYFLNAKKTKNEKELLEFQELREELKTSLIGGMTVPDYKYLKFIEFTQSRNIDLRKLEKQDRLDFNDPEWNELANKIK